MECHQTAKIENSDVAGAEIREYTTVHDSVIGEDSRIYERVSIKKSTVGQSVDVNANSYIENAEIADRVQVGPNASVVGVTHTLTAEGMEHRNDQFETVVLAEGAFLGAGAVVLPGVRVGTNAVVGANVTVTDDVPANEVVRSPQNE